MKSIVLNQLNEANGLYSLILQNHLYGCFIIMEDIALGVYDVSGTVLSTPKFTFDYDKQFSDIGIRFGFLMDTKLSTTFSSDYKEAWLKQFKEIDLEREIATVDTIEDSLIEVIQEAKDDFFMNALETGSLPQEWLEKVLELLSSDSSDSSDRPTAISTAITEKPMYSTKVPKKRNKLTRRALKPNNFKTRKR